MTKVGNLWRRRRGGTKDAARPPGPRHDPRISPTTPGDCFRACASFSGGLVVGGDRRRTELAGKLARLAALAGTADTGAAPDTPGLATEVFDALLAAGTAALECGGEKDLRLARLISDTVLTDRKNSRAGWRLRARTLEALGDEPAALEAYERCLELTTDPGSGLTLKVAGMRVAVRQRQDLLHLLAQECPAAAEFTGAAAADVWAEGVRLHRAGDHGKAEPRLVGALLALGAPGRPAGPLEESAGRYLDLRIAAAGGDASGLGELIGLYAGLRRSHLRPPLQDPTLGGVGWLGLGEFRNLIAGRSVCLVANSERLAGSSLGPQIDGYDLVVRFSSYLLDAPDTGTRTDLHAVHHEHPFNLDRPVTTRLVLGASPEEWRTAVRDQLVPGAQRFVGDESLAWPLRRIGRVGWEAWPSVPTTGFNILWLLDFLDVSPALDLFGFDFYASGLRRLPEAAAVPATSERERQNEKRWVMERARSVTDLRISLR